MKTDGGLRSHPVCPNDAHPEKTLLGPPRGGGASHAAPIRTPIIVIYRCAFLSKIWLGPRRLRHSPLASLRCTSL